MLLEALAACAGVTLGVAKDAPVGFREIRLSFDLDTGASDEQLATLTRLTERYCVVLQTLRQVPAISVRYFNTSDRSYATIRFSIMCGTMAMLPTGTNA
jgi:hypothetical protein